MSEPEEPRAEAGEVTALLDRWVAGDAQAIERLLPLVYGELRGIAGRLFRREREGHTLQPTALLHEAFLKLTGRRDGVYRDRAHFYAVASQAMRQVLVDYARARRTAKRGGEATLVAIDEVRHGSAPTLAAVDVLAIDEALERLAALDREQAQLVEMRFFGGLTVEEIADVLGVSTPTVKRNWRLARAFLTRELAPT